MQTNESLKIWTHVDDNDLTNALLLAQEKRKKEKKKKKKFTCALFGMKCAVIDTRLLAMRSFRGLRKSQAVSEDKGWEPQKRNRNA